eukprot:8614224-Ditylum_brightwellii.AAC.1
MKSDLFISMLQTKIKIVSIHQLGGRKAEAVHSSSSLLLSLIFARSDKVVMVTVNNGNEGVTNLRNDNDKSISVGYINNKSDSNTGNGVDTNEKELISRNNDVIAAKGVIETEAIVEVEEQDEDSNLA